MIVFKSVGSALQDLALASRYYEKLGAKREFPRGAGVGELRRQDVRPGRRHRQLASLDHASISASIDVLLMHRQEAGAPNHESGRRTR